MLVYSTIVRILCDKEFEIKFSFDTTILQLIRYPYTNRFLSDNLKLFDKIVRVFDRQLHENSRAKETLCQSQLRAYVYGPSGVNSENGSGGQNNSGGYSYDQPAKNIGQSGDTGPATIQQFRLIQKAARNAAYSTTGVCSFMPNDDSNAYAPSRAAQQWRSQQNSTTTASSFNSYGYPTQGSEPGGISFGQDNASEGNRFAYFNVQCYAVIKPTTVVAV